MTKEPTIGAVTQMWPSFHDPDSSAKMNGAMRVGKFKAFNKAGTALLVRLWLEIHSAEVPNSFPQGNADRCLGAVRRR